MTEYDLEYPLQEGYVHNWLVAGPLATPMPGLCQPPAGEQPRPPRALEIHEPPVKGGTFQIGSNELEWRYGRCEQDHVLDLSATYDACYNLRTWAYAQLVLPSAQEVTLVLTTNGPADLWLNRAHLQGQAGPSPDRTHQSFQCTLEEGKNELLIRFETTVLHESLYVMALRIESDAASEIRVELPVPYKNVYRRQKLERVYEHAHLEHLVSIRGADVLLHWDNELTETDEIGRWVRDANGMISVYGQAHATPGSSARIGAGHLTLQHGPHYVDLLPPSHVIERYGIRYQKRLPFYVLEEPHSSAYYGTYAGRRQEALAHSAQRKGNLYAEIAKAALGQWVAVDTDIVQNAISQVYRQQVGSVEKLLGLLGLAQRYSDRPVYTPESEQTLQDSALNYVYWKAAGEPEVDVMRRTSEGNAILFYVCEILAGQAYPEQTFAHSGQNGTWHRARGEGMAEAWIEQRGTQGFDEWDSPLGFERITIALTHLADLAENQELAERAAILLDKLFFTLAVNSFKGVFGSTHAHAQAAALKSGHLEATAGITRLLWGAGTWNQQIAGLVALASSDYELPTMIASIAVDLDDEMWHREHHPGVDKATYRTPDYLLCSAQDHRPGEYGRTEHIWQATLGPEAVVFVNHPACASESDARQPNYWAGNRVLPRVAQWKEALIALYELAPDEAMGFTHAYWPAYEFDESEIGGNWAFARKGEAYIALGCSQALCQVQSGAGAFRELRAARVPKGGVQAWICLLGRKAMHRSFLEFQDRIRTLKIEWQERGVQAETLRGERLTLPWEGPFEVNGAKQPLTGTMHYDGPHCRAPWPASQMDIQYGDYAVRLHLGR